MGKALRPVSIAGIEFDALIAESRTLSADTPEYPVETGYTVSDSIILKPETLDMTLYLTDSPVTWKRRFGGGPGRVQSVIKRLEDAYFGKEPVTVVTTDKTYTNMAIVSISISKTLEAGYAHEIPVSLKEIRVTKSATTTIPASYGKSGKTKSNAGTSGTKKSNTGGGSSSTSSGTSGANPRRAGSILYNVANSVGLL